MNAIWVLTITLTMLGETFTLEVPDEYASAMECQFAQAIGGTVLMLHPDYDPDTMKLEGKCERKPGDGK